MQDHKVDWSKVLWIAVRATALAVAVWAAFLLIKAATADAAPLKWQSASEVTQLERNYVFAARVRGCQTVTSTAHFTLGTIPPKTRGGHLRLVKTWCYTLTRITQAPTPHLTVHVSDKAAVLGVDDERVDAVDQFYPWRPNRPRSGHHSWRSVKFNQCIPLPGGCQPVKRSRITVYIRAHAGGSFTKGPLRQ